MAFTDLSEFITLLERWGHLKRIQARVSPKLEITEITNRVSKGPLEENVALLFEDKVINGLWGLGLMMLTKCIIAFDADVDVQNVRQAMFHALNNVDWARFDT